MATKKQGGSAAARRVVRMTSASGANKAEGRGVVRNLRGKTTYLTPRAQIQRSATAARKEGKSKAFVAKLKTAERRVVRRSRTATPKTTGKGRRTS